MERKLTMQTFENWIFVFAESPSAAEWKMLPLISGSWWIFWTKERTRRKRNEIHWEKPSGRDFLPLYSGDRRRKWNWDPKPCKAFLITTSLSPKRSITMEHCCEKVELRSKAFLITTSLSLKRSITMDHCCEKVELIFKAFLITTSLSLKRSITMDHCCEIGGNDLIWFFNVF